MRLGIRLAELQKTYFDHDLTLYIIGLLHIG